MAHNLVQPIAVSKTGGHENIVKAVALASVLAYIHTGELDAQNWNPWLASLFTKSVRRGTNTQFAACHADMAGSAKFGTAEAVASIPIEDSVLRERDPWRKMQVAGLERDREGWDELPPVGPHLAINPQVEMSTGKTAAQVAHGLFAWYLSMDEDTRIDWQGFGCPFGVTDDSEAWEDAMFREPRIKIVDAGHTEIEPGTLTVIADWI